MPKIGRWMLLAALVAACTTGDPQGGDGLARRTATRAALTASRTLGWKESGLAFHAASAERKAAGPDAVAIGSDGVYVLDAANGRVVRLGDAAAPATIASVPNDAVDLVVAADGAFAVLRQSKPEVVVFDPAGRRVGVVDASAVEDVSSIGLGRSRRVSVTTGMQETFALGSPAMPQAAVAIRASKREGADQLPTGEGIVVVRTDAGDLELRVVTQPGAEASRIVARRTLGRGDGARVVGVSGTVACAKIERLGASSDAVNVDREAVCVDVAAAREVLRVPLPPPGAYVPRRELAVGHGALAFVRPTDEGLELRTWSLRDGGAR